MTTTMESSEPQQVSHSRRIPGETGIWVFLMGDMLVFALLFGVVALMRAENREVFDASAGMVSPLYGLVYTLLLLASSWAIVLAVSAARQGAVNLSSRLVVWGFAGGAAFLVIKLTEYGTKFAAGVTPLTDQFFMLYFVLTFIHLLHVCAGLGVLVYIRKQVCALATVGAQDHPHRLRMIEVGAVYWHMVDLLWIVLFALFYLRS